MYSPSEIFRAASKICSAALCFIQLIQFSIMSSEIINWAYFSMSLLAIFINGIQFIYYISDQSGHTFICWYMLSIAANFSLLMMAGPKLVPDELSSFALISSSILLMGENVLIMMVAIVYMRKESPKKDNIIANEPNNGIELARLN